MLVNMFATDPYDITTMHPKSCKIQPQFSIMLSSDKTETLNTIQGYTSATPISNCNQNVKI